MVGKKPGTHVPPNDMKSPPPAAAAFQREAQVAASIADIQAINFQKSIANNDKLLRAKKALVDNGRLLN